MQTPTPQAIWNLTDNEFSALLESNLLKPLNGTVRFYAPSFTYYRSQQFCASTNEFPTISVTGNNCALNCRHCGGSLLKTMHPASTPQALFGVGSKLKAEGAKGVLISGGCLKDGSVPLDEFASAIAQLKNDLGLTVFVHTGIIQPKTALALKAAGIDAALIDVIGSRQTIESTFNLDVTVDDYRLSLQALEDAGLLVVPHVIVGLNGGKLDGEAQAIQIIAENCKPQAVVVIAFMPIRGTQMANAPAPKPLDIARTVAAARVTFPDTPIRLGCMRPKGTSRDVADVLALKAGVDGIAFPSQQAIEYAEQARYKVEFSSYCCADVSGCAK